MYIFWHLSVKSPIFSTHTTLEEATLSQPGLCLEMEFTAGLFVFNFLF